MAGMDDTLGGAEQGGLFSRLQTRYGLRADPLDMDTPFFPDAQRQHTLETLRHLCGFGDMVLLLTGPKGSGKTRILAELIRGESSRLAFHRLSTAALTSTQALARELMSIVRQSPAGNGSPRDAVYGFFRWSEGTTRRGQRLVLLVDNADQMPGEVLDLLASAFRAADATVAAVPVLSGSDELVQALGLVDQGVHQMHLKPLGREEIRRYLEPRIQAAGGRVSELLSERNLSRIHELSQGSFSRLKRVTPAIWLDLTSPPRGSAMPGLATLRWPALALILLALSWWLVSAQYESVSEPVEVVSEPAVVRKMISVGPERRGRATVPEDEARGEVVEQVDVGALDSEAEIVSPSEEEVPSPLPRTRQQDALPDLTQVSDDDPAGGNNDESDLKPETSEMPQVEPESSREEPQNSGVDVSGSESETADPGAEPVQLGDAEPVNDLVGSVPGSGSTPVQTQTTSTFDPALPERFVPAENFQGSTGFTAQFIAGFEEETAESFLNRHENIDQLQYTLSERKGQPWFVVFYGEFASEQEARAAQESFPPALRQQQPWIRPLGTL